MDIDFLLNEGATSEREEVDKILEVWYKQLLKVNEMDNIDFQKECEEVMDQEILDEKDEENNKMVRASYNLFMYCKKKFK